MDAIIASVREFVLSEIAPPGVEPGDLDLHTALIEEEIIDSLGIYSVVAFLSETHGVEISDDHISIANFESLAALGELIQQLRGPALA